MQISMIDKSNYLKGLLITARKDKNLAESERKIITGIAERLGFAKDFYEETLQTLLANKYITEEPIEFSDTKIAESFIIDGLRLAYSDNYIESTEIDWLRKTASANGLTEKWFDEKVNSFKINEQSSSRNDFALLSII